MMILIFASIFFNNQSLSAHYTKTLVFLWHTYVIFSIQYFYQFLCFFPAAVLN
jgi:hypothetical protein